MLEAYEPYLRERWNAGCTDAADCDETYLTFTDVWTSLSAVTLLVVVDDSGSMCEEFEARMAPVAPGHELLVTARPGEVASGRVARVAPVRKQLARRRVRRREALGYECAAAAPAHGMQVSGLDEA